MLPNTHPAEISFMDVLDALLIESKPLNPRFLFRLSDLEAGELRELEKIWGEVPDWRRQALLEDLDELSGNDYLLSFEAIGRLALEDSDPKVRFFAIQLLSEYDTIDLVSTYLRMMETDADTDVRSIAAFILGKYVYLGEVDKLAPQMLQEIEDRLLQVIRGVDAGLVRRRALESLGYSSREEIPELISTAFEDKDTGWQASALMAMGRSCDERWREQVLAMLDHDLAAIRFEATRAAGELEISEASPRLLELLEDDDEDIQSAAIWSLSQIGGEGVQEALINLLNQAEEEREIAFLENALDNLIFTESLDGFDLMEFPDNSQ
jgi:hypothetical protein